ncbi:MAG TPA: formate dehydrogenase subunit alpha [Bryobacteraceae bacterium]|nr:formate dehydrogenase subunit alpha [Bryobacteraceae bacterium]
MSPMIRIDGLPVQTVEGERLVDAINRAGVPLSQVCYHPQLGPIQTCDTCIVEVNNELVRACGTSAPMSGEVRVASSPGARAAREAAFQKLLANHELYCSVCDRNNGNCTVHNTAEQLHINKQKIPFRPKPGAKCDSNAFYRYDPDQCILCGRCVEACQNVQVNETLSIRWEDEHPRVLWDGGAPIAESSCVSCGHCVSVCPCNALMENKMIGHAGAMTGLPKPVLNTMIKIVKAAEPITGYRPIFAISDAESKTRESYIHRTKTVCTYCGVGCSFDVWTGGAWQDQRHILKIAPSEGPANGISTCIKGKFAWDFINDPARLTKPLIRRDGELKEASWDEALDLIERNFKRIHAEHGPDALAFISSSKCTNEESYLMQKLARAVIGTNNIDNCSRYCQAPATTGLFRTVGYGGDSGSISDIAQATLVVIIGSNTAESHPVLATRVKRAHKLHGQKLIVSDLRENEMARRADIHLHCAPGTDIVWLCAAARWILDNGLAKTEFLDRWVNGLEEFRRKLEPFTMDFAAEQTGVPRETLETAARQIATEERVCILWAMGVTQHTNGSDTSTAISNLLLVTGNYMRPGTGAYPLRGHNNVQGASDCGSMPKSFPGYQHVEEPEIRRKFEQGWGVPLSDKKGLDNHEMVDAILEGRLKSMYIIGEEMHLVDSNTNYTGKALSQLDFLVVQDIFLSETSKYAHVVLPGAPSLEKEGTFTSTERRIQRLYRALTPLGESLPDWEILQNVANRLGANWNYRHPSEIMAELASLTPLYAGVTYDRLAGYRSLQWPVAPDGADEPLLYTKQFQFPDGKAKLYPLEWKPPAERSDAEYDLHLNNGRMLEHFHEGNLTYRSPGIKENAPDTFVEVSRQLADERGLASGHWVRLESRRGHVRVRALVTDRVTGHELYMPMNSSTSPVNLLTGSHTDLPTHTPAYKDTAVRMQVLGERSESPLPRRNHRFGCPTPQSGVEVERRWKKDRR